MGWHPQAIKIAELGKTDYRTSMHVQNSMTTITLSPLLYNLACFHTFTEYTITSENGVRIYSNIHNDFLKKNR